MRSALDRSRNTPIVDVTFALTVVLWVTEPIRAVLDRSIRLGRGPCQSRRQLRTSRRSASKWSRNSASAAPPRADSIAVSMNDKIVSV